MAGRRKREQAKNVSFVRGGPTAASAEIGFLAGDDYRRLEALLQTIRLHLEATRDHAPRVFPLWAKADAIVRQVAARTAARGKGERVLWLPPEAVRLFNELADVPVPLQIRGFGVDIARTRSVVISGPQLRVDHVAGSLALLLYVDLFLNPKGVRAKVCEFCGKVFVDRSRGNTARRCSAACTWRRWSRAARKAAGHGRQGK